MEHLLTTTEVECRTYPAAQLREFSTRVFTHCGLTKEHAAAAADILATADLLGIDSHGVARLRAYYELLARGYANPRPRVTVTRELPATASLDGDNGLGLVVGPLANEIAMSKAEAVGSACVTVCHSSHFGIAGYYQRQALARDLIGWAMTNTTPQVAPLWGAEKMLGTNPVAIAFPGKEEPPIMIDMATSVVSYGAIENAARREESIPHGWAIDGAGRATTSPEEMMRDGALLPLGSEREHGGHRGYCLGVLVDALCGILSGANWGPFVPPFPYYLSRPGRSVGKGIGHVFGALRIDGFMEVDEFKGRVDEWVRAFRAAEPAPETGGPLIPGDPERAAQATRSVEGIPLLASVVKELRHVSAETGIAFD